jgi:hypothetical protein
MRPNNKVHLSKIFRRELDFLAAEATIAGPGGSHACRLSNRNGKKATSFNLRCGGLLQIRDLATTVCNSVEDLVNEWEKLPPLYRPIIFSNTD